MILHLAVLIVRQVRCLYYLHQASRDPLPAFSGVT